MLVKNNTEKYMIAKLENGFIDTNGCYYKELTEQQRHIHEKIYFYDILAREEGLILKIKKIAADIEKWNEKDIKVVFYEMPVADYCFQAGCLCGNSSIEFNDILVNSRNPELFLSYISMIIGKKDYCGMFLDWLNYTITDKNGIKPDVYVYVFYAFATGKDGIISEMLKKGMWKTLYDFLRFYYIERVPNTQCRTMLKLSECMEKEFFKDHIRLYKSNDDYGFYLFRDLLNSYGKEALGSIIKFIKSMKMLHENSLFQKKAFEQTSEILKTLCNIHMTIPESTFDKNINYLLKMLFRNYEDRISLEGFLNVSKMWQDYLLMRNIKDEDYPDSVKEAHDRVQKTYKGNNYSKEILAMFPSAVKTYENLVYNDNRYQIKVPKSPMEMAEVGKKLKICVGSYATAVARRNTQVLWLCKEDKEIVAIEVRNGRLIQAKAENNHFPNAEEEAFIKRWCKEKTIDIVSY